MGPAPLQGIVNLKINTFKLSQCFHIFLGKKVLHKEHVLGLPADTAECGDRCGWHGFMIPSSALGASGISSSQIYSGAPDHTE